MTIRRSGFRPQSRRITDWGLGPGSTSVGFSGTGKKLWTLGTTPAANLTLIRTRGQFHVTLLTASQAGGGFTGAVGIYMMTEDAFLIGVTAALDPSVDSNSDMWLWHSFWSLKTTTATIGDGVNAVGVTQRILIDSKAMRKDFDPERVMVGVVGVDEEAGTSTAEFVAETR